jgi:hypothetical protein
MSTIACAAVLASCGESDDPEPSIPQPAGEAIVAALEKAQTEIEEGQCDDAEATAQNIRDAIDVLPPDVPNDIQQTLIRASDNLVALTRDPEQCEQKEPKPPEPPEPPTGATGEEGAVSG